MNCEEVKSFNSSIKISYQTDEKFHRIADAKSLTPGSLLFITNGKFWNLVRGESFSGVGLIFDQKVFESLEKEEIQQIEKSAAMVACTQDAELMMTKLSEVYYEQARENWNDEVDGRQMGTADIHPSSYIAQNVFIGKDVVIGKNVRIHPGVRVLSNSSIGDDCEIFPGVVIYQNVKIGHRVRLHGNSTIGADGFGYNFREGVHHKLWHLGGVVIEDDVEVGSNSCVDGGTFSPTKIGRGTKLDNHVQIGHNCILGMGVIICGHVAIGGSSELGDFTVFGGKSGMGHGMKLGKACQVGGGALVNRDWPDGSVLGGHPARPLKEWMKGLAYVRNQVSKKSE